MIFYLAFIAYAAGVIYTFPRVYMAFYREMAEGPYTSWDNYDRFMCAFIASVFALIWPAVLVIKFLFTIVLPYIVEMERRKDGRKERL